MCINPLSEWGYWQLRSSLHLFALVSLICTSSLITPTNQGVTACSETNICRLSGTGLICSVEAVTVPQFGKSFPLISTVSCCIMASERSLMLVEPAVGELMVPQPGEPSKLHVLLHSFTDPFRCSWWDFNTYIALWFLTYHSVCD